MNYKFGKTIVISLGGSIIYPESIDIIFLKKFNKFIRKFIKRDYKFVIVTGGGKPARIFQEAAAEISRISNDDKDWIGIHTTRLNAQLLRTIFKDVADPEIIDAKEKSIERAKTKKTSVAKPRINANLWYGVTIGSGWRPGWSTDYIAASIAADFGVKEFINAGKPAYVFEKDPKKFPKAKKFEKLSWGEYRKLIPSKWIPGFNSPVDPIAAKLCQKEKMAAIVINGKDLRNFGNLLDGKNFKGTIVS
ncbi:MAG: UMP kinase [Patescibacteria group bacterium]